MPPKLIVPEEKYIESYYEACAGIWGQGYSGIDDPALYSEWKHTVIQRLRDESAGIGLPEGYVPASTFWLVEDNAFIGLGSIRHRLTPALENFGGHIGYMVRKDKWGQGYGTRLLSLLLPEANRLGIEKALVTCNETNIASARIIERNGGILEDIREDIIDGAPRRTKRYWIDT